MLESGGRFVQPETGHLIAASTRRRSDSNSRSLDSLGRRDRDAAYLAVLRYLRAHDRCRGLGGSIEIDRAGDLADGFAQPQPAASKRSTARRRSPARHRTKHRQSAGSNNGAPRYHSPAGTSGVSLMFGNQKIGQLADQNPAGLVRAFPFTDSTGGKASSISVYVGAANRATTLIAGLYAGNGGHPGSKLAADRSPRRRRARGTPWPFRPCRSPRRDLLASDPRSRRGSISVRSGRAMHQRQLALRGLTRTALPGDGRPGVERCPVSAFVGGTPAADGTSGSGGGTSATLGTAAPGRRHGCASVGAREQRLPTIGGQTWVGQTLTSSTGTWTGAL